ncbi:MAG: hypothetical protein ABL925_17110, partial [Methylococcales bacterium]
MTEISEVPSPFCGIGTDDLTIKVDGVTLKVLENGCAEVQIDSTFSSPEHSLVKFNPLLNWRSAQVWD